MHLACQIVNGTKSLIDNKDNITALHLYGPFHTAGSQRHCWLPGTTGLEMWLLLATIEQQSYNRAHKKESPPLRSEFSSIHSPHPDTFGPS